MRDLRLRKKFFLTIGRYDAACAAKTLIGAWHTSRRMHEATTRDCLFGCANKKDELDHYSICDVLRGMFCGLPHLAHIEGECLFGGHSERALLRSARGYQLYSNK